MTMPANIARDPRKRREYLLNLCGLPDGQKTFEDPDSIDDDIQKVHENE
jgi:hypothetical protein